MKKLLLLFFLGSCVLACNNSTDTSDDAGTAPNSTNVQNVNGSVPDTSSVMTLNQSLPVDSSHLKDSTSR